MNRPTAGEGREPEPDGHCVTPVTRVGLGKRKFAVAFSGLVHGVRGHSSFFVHLPVAALVVGFAFFLDAASWQWAVLLLCITGVLVAELFNSALETLVRRIHPMHDPEIGKTLDIAAAAVLVASIGAIFVGAVVLWPLILQRFFG